MLNKAWLEGLLRHRRLVSTDVENLSKEELKFILKIKLPQLLGYLDNLEFIIKNYEK